MLPRQYHSQSALGSFGGRGAKWSWANTQRLGDPEFVPGSIKPLGPTQEALSLHSRFHGSMVTQALKTTPAMTCALRPQPMLP